MGIEVDFLAVGDGKRSGDAIALRLGNLEGPRDEQVVMIIDGGTTESGERLADHVRYVYQTAWVDFALLTHPDSDHASGFRAAVERLDVGQIVMHKPWEHGDAIRTLFANGRITVSGLERRFREALEATWDVAQLASKRRIPVFEPFTGATALNGIFRILGPSETYYRALLPSFRCTPQPDLNSLSLLELLARGSPAPPAKPLDLLSSLGFPPDAPRLVRESGFTETLTDDGETKAENNSSVILLIQFEGRKLLFTGDAGIPALEAAHAYAASIGIQLDDLALLQVPHHGSRRNLGPAILNKIRAELAVISAGVDGAPKHPSAKVTNALIRRGTTVLATQGTNLFYRYNALPRTGYHDVYPLEFTEYVDT